MTEEAKKERKPTRRETYEQVTQDRLAYMRERLTHDMNWYEIPAQCVIEAWEAVKDHAED